MDFSLNPITSIISIVILVYSAILHEIAHGFVADRLGDPTARLMGRLTLDPRPHIDPMLSIAIPLLLIFSGSPVIFGGAKPVPIDPFNLKEGRKDMALVALVGPLTNIVIAIIAGLTLRILYQGDISGISFAYTNFAVFLLYTVVQLNLLLAIFNLLPIPPLDGSKVFALILPEKDARAYLALGNIGILIIFFLLMFPIGGFSLGRIIASLMNLGLNLILP